jgi:hypothetical protein
MLPLALATFAEPFIFHISFVFITINVVIDVGISVYIYVYVSTMPVAVSPCISPRSPHSKAYPNANKPTGRRREERTEGRKRRPPPASINHRRVVTRDIDLLGVYRFNDNRLLFHNDFLLFCGF